MGNQLFQLSATISLAANNNDQYIFPPWEYEKYFNLHNCFSSHIQPTQTYTEPAFHYTEIPLKQTTGQIVNLNGFYQSHKYFENNRDIILNLLTPNIGFGIKWGYTAIHVRRGDYVNLQNCYQQLDVAYYNQAMRMINSRHYIVFSDDIGWCKQNFVGGDFIFSEGRSPVEDLALQLACENNIIANSSFSWWGAYLNINPLKKVIAPAAWFGPELPHNTKDLLPESWVKI